MLRWSRVNIFLVFLIVFLLTTAYSQSLPSYSNNIATQAALTDTAISSLRADHVMLRVPNFKETIQWYKEKLGFEEVLRWKNPSLPELDLAYIEHNGSRIEIIGGGTPKAMTSLPKNVREHLQTQGYRHLCLRVNDVDAVLAELNQRGVPTFAEAYNYQPIQRRLGFILDNNGNLIEFSGPIKSSKT